MIDILQRLREVNVAWNEEGELIAEAAMEIERLRGDLAKFQESEFHPDWSKLEATRESLREHMELLATERQQARMPEELVERLFEYRDGDRLWLTAERDKLILDLLAWHEQQA